MAISSSTIENLVGLSEKVLGDTVNVLLDDKNTLLTSGLAATSEVVDRVAGGGSRKATIPFLNPLDANVVNVSNDDINDDGEVGNQTGSEFFALRHDLNMGWGFTDVAQAVTKYDAKGGMPAYIAEYWNNVYTKVAVSTFVGALKVNAGLTYTSAAGAQVYDALMLASATGGLHADDFDILCVGPQRYAQMRIDNKTAFRPASETESRFDEWNGFKLIKTKAFGSDMLLARSGALAFGVGVPVPFIETEYERLANKGNGAGADILHSRRSIVCQPQGFSYKGPIAPTVLKAGAVNPQIETQANWDLIVPDLEQIGFRKVVMTPAA